LKSTRQKKLLVFFDAIVHFGGSGQVTLRTIKEMKRYCDVLVLDAYGVCREYHEAMKRFGIASEVLLEGSKYHRIGGRGRLGRGWRVLAAGLEMLKVIRRLRTRLAEIQPDAVWTTSNKGLFFLSRAAGKEVVMVYFAHGERAYPAWYNRRAWKQLPLVTGVCRGSFERLAGSRYEPEAMEVIYNGIDIEQTVKRSERLVSELPGGDGLRLLLPGSLNENKNQAMAIRGLAEYAKTGGRAQLLLAGDFVPGPGEEYARRLHELARRLDVSQSVHFLGWRDDVAAVMARADVVVLTSYSEGMPMVVLEAMCLKKPVIATRVGGIPEVLRDGVDGILVEPGDHEAFARAIAKLADTKLRERMGEDGFERVKACFEIKTTARRFVEAVSRIC